MFNRGVDELLNSLPSFAGLSADDVRRQLTQAWLEAADIRAENLDPGVTVSMASELRRLATALEVHAILPFEIAAATVHACAFVAAESLMIAHDLAPLAEREHQFWVFGSTQRFEQIEAGLLYLIAGYDANAALTAKHAGVRDNPQVEESELAVSEWAFERVRALLTMRGIAEQRPAPETVQNSSLRTRVRHEVWRLIGSHVEDHIRWLMFEAQENPMSGRALRDLADRLERPQTSLAGSAQHSDLHHLVLLLAAACDATGDRALRNVPAPDGDGGRFNAYQQRRARSRPLLWPAAHEYAAKTLPGPHQHAVVAVPTGSGKSAVAELAIAQALPQGWVLYLAPTNALVGQIRRACADAFDAGIIREFIGGAEYTQLHGEALDNIQNRQILIMTPEKCSLALRQDPAAFDRLSLCILDEAHILGDRKRRGVIAELVISEILHRAPQTRILLMSALLGNPSDLAAWLSSATDLPAAVIDRPWRPTRTLRAIAGFDSQRLNPLANGAWRALQGMGKHRVKNKFKAPMALLGGLQGTWRSTSPSDYDLVQTDVQIELGINRRRTLVDDGYVNPAVAALVQHLGERGERILAFLPSSKHYSFLVATTMKGFSTDPCQLGPTVDAFLTLAELELGTTTALRETLGRRVAVHTSALLREEQRASEVAFDQEIAYAMFATGTLAQGLNLPATAVVIGGTDVGYDPDASTEQNRQRSRAQLLNAIGRAGRAHIAARSIAIVVPNDATYFRSADDAAEAVLSAEFLREEDASTNVFSRLGRLIEEIQSGELDLEQLGEADQTAFAFLSFAGNYEDAQGVLRKTWAIHDTGAEADVSSIIGTINAGGSEVLAQNGAPSWVALAAHRSGISLAGTAQLYHGLRSHLEGKAAPENLQQWAKLMLKILRTFRPAALEEVLPKNAYGTSSRLANIYSADPEMRRTAWRAFKRALDSWMDGEPLIELTRHIHPRPITGDSARRKAGDPLPRAIAVVGEGFTFGLALVAGALGALIATGQEEDPMGPWNLDSDSLRHLNLLPLATRSGASTPEVIAWMRAGVQPRTAAHILSALIEPTPGQTDDQLQRWAYGRLMELLDGTLIGVTTEGQDQIVRALAAVRAVR